MSKLKNILSRFRFFWSYKRLSNNARKEVDKAETKILALFKARIKAKARWERRRLYLCDIFIAGYTINNAGNFTAIIAGGGSSYFNTGQQAKNFCEAELDKFIDELLKEEV